MILGASTDGSIFLPFSNAFASFFKVVFERIQPNNSAVSLEPGELPFGELADGGSEQNVQVVERTQLSAEIPCYVAVLYAQFLQSGI